MNKIIFGIMGIIIWFISEGIWGVWLGTGISLIGLAIMHFAFFND